MPLRRAEFNRRAPDILRGFRHSINEAADRLCGSPARLIFESGPRLTGSSSKLRSLRWLHPPCSRSARAVRLWRWRRRTRRAAGSRRRTAGRSSGSRSGSSEPLATGSRTGRSQRRVERACLPRKSTPRSSPARSTPRCTQPRTCHRSCPTAWRSAPICRARTCATRSSHRWPTQSRACRAAQRSAPPRCAVRPRRSGFAPTSSPRSCAAMSKRG